MHTIVTARIKLTLTDGEVIISLFDRSSARDLLERLPRSLDFSDFAGAEKMASLPSLWITTNTPLAASTSSDFTYYAPWGNLAIFFRGYGQEGGIYALGKIELGKEWLAKYAVILPRSLGAWIRFQLLNYQWGMSMFKKTTKTIFLCVLILSGFARADTVAIKAFPAPETVSAEMRPFVSAPPLAFWNEHPKSDQEWREWVEKLAQKTRKKLPQLKARMQVSVEKQYFAGVPGFVVTPNQTAPENSHRVLLHFHGGGYVLNPGEAGIDEAIMMAGYGHIKVISIDYRMPPDFPFPAAIDDAVAAYKEIAKRYAPKDIGVFGTSTGGGITLALMLSIKEQGLPMPAAIALGTPWSDLSNTGDSYLTNEGVDNVLVSYSGWLGDAAKLYANGLDLKTPLLSPIYGDVQGLPPTLLVTGTRDLFLSNTVRMHLKLRQSGVIADLVVLEGLSHAQYLMAIDAPENQLYFLQCAQFFNRYLSQ